VRFYVGLERVGHSDESAIFAVQIGVTRVGAGGRAIARNGRGQLVPTHKLVIEEREPIETYPLPVPVKTYSTIVELPLTGLVLALTLRYSLARPTTPSALALKSRRALSRAVGYFVPNHVRGRSL
jgi:hypothetical protein